MGEATFVIESWDKKIDGNGGGDKARWVAVDSLDNVYAIGNGQNIVSGSSFFDWWIKKFNSDGEELWEKKINGGNDDRAYSVAVDSSDNVYVVGSGYYLVSDSSYIDWWIKKFLPDGTEVPAN